MNIKRITDRQRFSRHYYEQARLFAYLGLVESAKANQHIADQHSKEARCLLFKLCLIKMPASAEPNKNDLNWLFKRKKRRAMQSEILQMLIDTNPDTPEADFFRRVIAMRKA